MKIGLFIPCYINQFYPGVGIATYRLLRKLGFEVGYPMDQTCCGQPLANSGFERHTKDATNHFRKIFKQYQVIVSPSASCVLYVKQQQEFNHLPDQKIMELSQFLVEFDLLDQITVTFPKKVGVLQSCHGLRGLHLGKSSELMEGGEPMITQLLSKVKDIELVEPDRQDDCCGFGGTFSVKEPKLSVKMGRDRLDDFSRNGAEIITGTDMSCLMHLEGIIKKRKLALGVMHFSEILMPS